MKQKLIKVLCLAVALILLASLAACGGTSSTTNETKDQKPAANNQAVKLKCFVHYSEDDAKKSLDYAIAELKKDFPNVELVIDVMPTDNDEKIKTLAATGDLPDIIDINGSLITLFKQSNKLLVLDQYVKETGIESKFLPSALPLFKNRDGHIYAVPNGNKDIAALYYNKELFKANNIKVPTNYNEFLDAVKAFSAKKITPLELFAQQQWPGFTFYDSLVTRKEPAGFKKIDDGQASITEPAYKEAARKLVELVKAGLISKDAFTTSYDQAVAAFIDGRAAMFQNGSWDAKNIGDKMGDKVGILYQSALADPQDVESSKWNVVGGGFGNGFAVAANTKYKDIAAKYSCNLAEKLIAGRIVKCANVNAMLTGDYKSEIPYNALQQQLANDMKNFNAGTCWWWGVTNPKIASAVGENVAKLLTGEYEVDKFIGDMDKAIKEAQPK